MKCEAQGFTEEDFKHVALILGLLSSVKIFFSESLSFTFHRKACHGWRFFPRFRKIMQSPLAPEVEALVVQEVEALAGSGVWLHEDVGPVVPFLTLVRALVVNVSAQNFPHVFELILIAVAKVLGVVRHAILFPALFLPGQQRFAANVAV